MFGKNKNKTVGLCVMVVAACLVMAAVWAVLATPETALAKKPDNPGGGEPEALHGSATFRDALGDRVRSDGEGPYTYTGSGKGGAILLGLGDFFRLRVNVDKKVVGRRFVLDFDGLDIDPAFFPASQDFWVLYVQGTLEEWKAQELNVPCDRVGRLHFGTKGVDYAYVNYGAMPTLDGAPLTVKRIDTDVWTIQSFAPGDPEDPDELDDFAHLFREKGELFEYASMPFLITYYGQGMP